MYVQLHIVMLFICIYIYSHNRLATAKVHNMYSKHYIHVNIQFVRLLAVFVTARKRKLVVPRAQSCRTRIIIVANWRKVLLQSSLSCFVLFLYIIPSFSFHSPTLYPFYFCFIPKFLYILLFTLLFTLHIIYKDNFHFIVIKFRIF